MRYVDATCPDCGAALRVWWEGGESIGTECPHCGAQPVWEVETDVIVNLGQLLYDDRFAVRCVTCPTYVDSRTAGTLNGQPACPWCIKHPPVAVVSEVR